MVDNKEKIRAKYREVDTEVKVIKAKPKEDVYSSSKRLKVCAYCRVSTDNEEQTSSYELQKAHYDEYIQSQPNWELVDIYADEGLSGTSVEHRVQFNRMIADCEAGKIDVILTKSISRFARNVVDTLLTVRKLRLLPNPVRIIFETENLDTSDERGEMMLDIMAMLAQEESHTKSDIMNWSYHERFKRGHFLTPPLFGYRVNDEGEYEIQEDEAEIIRLVYAMYVTGYMPSEIAKTMTELGFKSNIKGDHNWNGNVVRNIIDNERRCGKLISWKTFTPSYLDHKKRKNTGQRDQYYRDDHHEGIIPVEMYEYAIAIKRLYKTAHFYGEIPSLSVIKTGALKGFVPVCRKYPGFTYDNYLVASNFAYDLDSKGNRKNKGDLLTKSDISEFDLMGYQKVDGQLLLSLKNPTLWFKYDEMFFNSACLGKINSEYIELLFEPSEGLLAIRSCDKNHPNAIRWARDKNGKLRTVNLSCSGFANLLFEALGWNTDHKYKMIGVKREKNGESVVLFSLEDAEPMTMEKIVYDDGTEIIAYNLYTNYFLDRFGKDIYEDAYSSRLYLMDVFKKWNLSAEVVPVENEKEWMKDAKILVEKYINQLKTTEG